MKRTKHTTRWREFSHPAIHRSVENRGSARASSVSPHVIACMRLFSLATQGSPCRSSPSTSSGKDLALVWGSQLVDLARAPFVNAPSNVGYKLERGHRSARARGLEPSATRNHSLLTSMEVGVQPYAILSLPCCPNQRSTFQHLSIVHSNYWYLAASTR